MRKAFVHMLVAFATLVAMLSLTEACSSPCVEMEGTAAVEEGTLSTAYVKLREGMAPVRSAALLEEFCSVVQMERVFPECGRFEARTVSAGLDRWYKLRFAGVATKAEAAVIDMVEFWEEVPTARLVWEGASPYAAALYDDEFLDRQWYLDNSPEDGVYGINVLPVWETFCKGSDLVTVAVLDDGVDFTHEDLAGCRAGAWNFCTDSLQTHPGSHGTFVAGEIAGISGNGRGIAGIAGGDASREILGVNILDCQVFDGDNEGDFAAAIKWAADNGAVICQNSWNFSYGSIAEAMRAELPQVLKEAIDYFVEYAGMDENGNQEGPMKGGLVFFASGNDGWPYSLPSQYENVVAVGAYTKDGRRGWYSNYGDWVDFCAPGGSSSGDGANDGIWGPVLGNLYESRYGTSMACPLAAGVAALVLSYFGGEGYTADMLLQRLMDGSSDLHAEYSAKIGRQIDALGAFSVGDILPPDAVEELEINTLAGDVTASWIVPADGEGKKAWATVFECFRDGCVTENPQIERERLISVRTPLLTKAGERISVSLEGLAYDTEYCIRAYAADYAGNLSDTTSCVHVITGHNRAPIIAGIPENTSLRVGDRAVIYPKVRDPEGQKCHLDYIPATESGVDVLEISSGGIQQITIDGSLAYPGEYVGKLTATDEGGESSTVDVRFTILENNAPEAYVDSIFHTIPGVGQSISIDMSSLFFDKDSDNLKYSYNSLRNKVISISRREDVLYVTAQEYGLGMILVSAEDRFGGKADCLIHVYTQNPDDMFSIYPTPVLSKMEVRSLVDRVVGMKLLSSTGQVLWSLKECNIGPFSPVVVDMSNYVQGRYVVIIEMEGKTWRKEVVKAGV